MAFDSFSLHRLISELQPLVGNQIRHIAQTESYEIAIRIGPYALLISAHPVHARIHLIPRMPKVKERERHHFSDFLMTHLMRGTVNRIEQIGLDRIVHIEVQPQGDLLRKEPRLLICEFMGKHSNIILVNLDTGKILESIKHIDSSLSSYREVLPGLDYIPPPQKPKLDPFRLTREEFLDVIRERPNQPDKAIVASIDGFSPVIAREVIFRAGVDDPEKMWEAYVEVIEAIRDEIGDGHPCVMLDRDGKPVAVGPLRLRQFEAQGARPVFFSSMSEALERFHARVIERERFLTERSQLIARLRRRRKAISEKLNELQMQMERAEDAETMRIKGELILSNLKSIRKGETEVMLHNFYDPQLRPIRVELSPELSPTQNAQLYFKRYAKAKRARVKLANVIADQEKMLQLLDEMIEEVEDLRSQAELDRLKEDLVRRGWMRREEAKGGRRKERESEPFRRFISSNGFEILVGRNNRENDLLTLRFANKNDIWLHAKNIQGSHVLIRNPEGREIPVPTLLEAASLAAYFSKAKHSSHVPVDYTLAKYVTKPRGAKEGFVIYTHEKTLFVEPRLLRERVNPEG